MEQNYNLNQKLIACVLLLNLLLQSCSNFSNSLIPRDSGEIEKEELSNQAVIKTKSIAIKQLIGKEFIAKGDHLVNFYEQAGELRADVEMNVPAGFSKTYRNLSVHIAQDINLAQLQQLHKEEQKKVIHFNRSKNDQISRVLVYRPGLLGGGDTGNNSEKEVKINQDISRLSDIKGLRKYFYKGYLEITPKNYEQLIELTQQYEFLFMSYEGGVFVKGWEGDRDLSRLIELLVLFSKIKKFKMNCAVQDESEIGEVVVRGIQYYNELEELDLSGCQLSDGTIKDILESIIFPEKLRILDVSNNNLSAEMVASLQVQFPNAQVRSSLQVSLENSSQPLVEGRLSKVIIPSPLIEKKSARLKKEEEELEEKEGAYKKPANELPRISYNAQRILDVLEGLPMSVQVKEQANLYLKNIRKKVGEIESYRTKKHPEDFYGPMQDAILEIHNIADELYKHTEAYHRTLPNRLRTLIIETITSFERELKKRLEMPASEREALRLKTKRLYAEQSYIARQPGLHTTLINHLGRVKQLLVQPGKPFPYCYISYAWPSKEHQKKEYWVQPFLSILYDHLTAAGIRMIMDIRDNKPGDSIYQFMGQYHKGNYIILVGTASLLEKHYSISPHAVQTELSIISNRFEKDQKAYGQSRIYPILVSGTNKSSFPEMYDKYHTVRDAREVGYVLMLRHLIDWICEQQVSKVEREYIKLWHVFDENFTGLTKEADTQEIEEEINVGYHRQRLEHLKQELQFQAVQAQEATKHSPAVAAKMVGVLMESQGKNPKLLYHEYGQKFQHPSITPDFIERKGLWDKIVIHFNQSEQQILTLSAHGLGGMGKIELARYYYLHPPRPYTLRAWFNAEDKERLYSQYIDLARANGIEYEKEMPIQEQARQVKNWLEIQKDCLLVYDNVLNAKQLEGLLPEQGKHHILITSRNAVGWPAHQKLDIEVMEEDEAMALICKITGCKEATIGLKELVNILGYMPLALAQAGAYIAEKQTSIEDYLNRYRKYQSILMSDATLDLNPKHAPVGITFNMNFKALEVACPSALTTLKQASWLAASAIPEILLENMLEGTKDEPAELLWDEVKRHIGRYSLMRIDSEGHQLSMHRLLQDILRSKQNGLERKEILNQIVLSIKRIHSESDNAKTMEKIALVRLLLPHMEAVLSHLKNNFNKRECNDFNLEYNLGEAYATIGNYVKAKKNLHDDLLIKQKRYKDYQIQVGEDIYIGKHLDIAKSLGNLGKVYYYLGEYQEALKYHEQALEMMQALWCGSDHSYIAGSLNNIGNVYQALGQYQEALKYYKQALEIWKDLYIGNHPNIATLINNIGIVYKALGQNESALKYYEQALEMRQAVYDYNHPDIASSLNNIGNFYKALGQNEAALKYFEQALEMWQTLYSSDHPYIAISLNNIGTVYSSLGQNESALKYYEQALEMRQALYSDGVHPHIASSLHNIGVGYQYLGHLQEALKYYEQALAMRQTLYSGSHPDIATLLNNIGTVYQALNQNEAALKYNEQALEMRQALYNRNHPDIAISLNNIGNVYKALGQNESALKYYDQALEMLQILYSGNHPDIATALNNIGSVYEALDKYEEASKYYQGALTIFEALNPGIHNHPAIQIVKGNMAFLKEKQQKEKQTHV